MAHPDSSRFRALDGRLGRGRALRAGHASVSPSPDRALAACERGLSPAAPPGADAEVVTCGARLGSK
jgi:hypothetical protein